jgi:histidinol-phosphate aminotransferase
VSGLLLLGPGPQAGDPAGFEPEFAALVRRVRRRSAERGLAGPVVAGGLPGPSRTPLAAAVAELAAAGVARVTVVPAVLGDGASGGPGGVPAPVRAGHPALEWVRARPLGPHPVLLGLLQRRLQEALGDIGSVGGPVPAGTAVLLVGAGSAEPAANAETAKVARLLWEGRGLELVEPAFAVLARPGVEAGLERCRALGARHVVVLPYLLFAGARHDRIAAQAATWARARPGVSLTVAAPLGDCDALADLVLDRYSEARGHDTRTSCDACPHRGARPSAPVWIAGPDLGPVREPPAGSRPGAGNQSLGEAGDPRGEPDLRHHGDAEVGAGLTDLAVNVRLPAPPEWLRERLAASLTGLAAYPDPARARAAVAARHGRDPDEVLLTAGAAEAFVLLARALRPRRAVVVHPQFTEPEAALRAAGHPVERVVLDPADGFALHPEAVPPQADLVIVGNPTNPTSVLHPPTTLAALARPGRLLVVDEAFADCVPGEAASLAGETGLAGLVVLRSLTKTWGLAGLRIGYLLAAPALVRALAEAQPLWSVSHPALVAAEACSTPVAVAEAAGGAVRLAAERDHLVNALAALPGLRLAAEPHASFVLVRLDGDPGGPAVRAALRERGFAVRRGDTFPGLGPDWLRLAVREPATTDALADALADVLGGARLRVLSR